MIVKIALKNTLYVPYPPHNMNSISFKEFLGNNFKGYFKCKNFMGSFMVEFLEDHVFEMVLMQMKLNDCYEIR